MRRLIKERKQLLLARVAWRQRGSSIALSLSFSLFLSLPLTLWSTGFSLVCVWRLATARWLRYFPHPPVVMLSGLCESETFYDWYLSRLTATAAKLEVQFVLWTGSGRREKERRWKKRHGLGFSTLSLSLSLSLSLAINSPGQCLFWLWLNMNTHCMFNCIRCTLQITWWSKKNVSLVLLFMY